MKDKYCSCKCQCKTLILQRLTGDKGQKCLWCKKGAHVKK